MTHPTVQTAEAAAKEWLRALFPHGSPMAQADLARKLVEVLTTRDSAIRADERGKVLEWRPIETAPKALPIIYLAKCPNTGGEFIGEAIWRDRDEEEPHWWDDSATMRVEPIAWMPRPKLMAEPTERDRERAREWLDSVGLFRTSEFVNGVAQLIADERKRAVSTVANWLVATTESARFVQPLIASIRQGDSP